MAGSLGSLVWSGLGGTFVTRGMAPATYTGQDSRSVLISSEARWLVTRLVIVFNALGLF